MKLIWTKCTEEMPVDNGETQVLVKTLMDVFLLTDGATLNQIKRDGYADERAHYWTQGEWCYFSDYVAYTLTK